MTEAQADKVMETLDQCGVEYQVYEDYSGRGMYGRTTTGIVCNLRPNEFKLTMLERFQDDAADEGEFYDMEDWTEEELLEKFYEKDDFPPLKYDNMGLQMIHY